MIDWGRTALLFPGQGSQSIGMGKDFAERFEIVRETFLQANEILGYDLTRICWDDADALNQTEHTQPALYVCSIAILRALRQQLPMAQPAWMAGHSLGEFTALTASGALAFEAGLRLVRRRGLLMQRAGDENPGAMAALLGLPIDALRALCDEVSAATGRPVVLANDNCPGQAVVSGDSLAVERLIDAAKSAGARRAVRLTVSVAAHSPLMATASADFQLAINETPLQMPGSHVIGNVEARQLETVAEIRSELNQQLMGAVRWTDSMNAIVEAGGMTFIEVGAGAVLSGLMRRINRRAARYSLNTVEAFDAFVEAASESSQDLVS